MEEQSTEVEAADPGAAEPEAETFDWRQGAPWWFATTLAAGMVGLIVWNGTLTGQIAELSATVQQSEARLSALPEDAGGVEDVVDAIEDIEGCVAYLRDVMYGVLPPEPEGWEALRRPCPWFLPGRAASSWGALGGR